MTVAAGFLLRKFHRRDRYHHSFSGRNTMHAPVTEQSPPERPKEPEYAEGSDLGVEARRDAAEDLKIEARRDGNSKKFHTRRCPMTSLAGFFIAKIRSNGRYPR